MTNVQGYLKKVPKCIGYTDRHGEQAWARAGCEWRQKALRYERKHPESHYTLACLSIQCEACSRAEAKEQEHG